MKKITQKIISIFLLISIMISNLPLGMVFAYTRPSISVSSPSASSVNAGGSVSYNISYSDVDNINLSSSYVVLNGFTANVSVTGNGNDRKITLTNIQGATGRKSIAIKANSASNENGSCYATPNSVSFLLKNDTDKVRPSISVSEPTSRQVYKGGSLSYTITFADNKAVNKINLTSSYVTLNGFTANISITGKGTNRLVTLTNIQGTAGKGKNIAIKSGAAEDAAGNSTLATPNSISFELLEKKTNNVTNTNKTQTQSSINKNNNTAAANSNKNTGTNSSTNKNNTNNNASISTNKPVLDIKNSPKIVSGCEDGLNVLGDINKEVKTFSSWLTSKKDSSTFVQENNYVAKNQEVTYIVDYYNGKEEKAENVSMSLHIPYNVSIVEINGDGKIKTQTTSETVIEWNKGSIQKAAKCRLYVKVKYLENTTLQKSNNISEKFYVTLETKYDAKTETSYLTQLFVDNSNNKVATATKYASVDSSNSFRSEDKITRAELAKLLVDAGIVNSKAANSNYKKYKDAEEIPEDSRNAVSALYGTGIIETFSDGEFKPSNPVARDELFAIIARASKYVSNGKLSIKTSTFIYTDEIEDKDGTITDNKYYIMELIRQNIVDKEDVRADEYALRKDAVEMINALTYRGPYVKNITGNILKPSDIAAANDSYYNVLGAINTYTYKFTDKLLQQIISGK